MIERNWDEIERVLLYIGDARARADRAGTELARDDAPAHVVEALADPARRMADAYRALAQGTYSAIEPAAHDGRSQCAGTTPDEAVVSSSPACTFKLR